LIPPAAPEAPPVSAPVRAGTLALHTLGCKLNQAETEAIAAAFEERGFALVPWGADADILLVNTCTVTSMAEQKARRVIRKALRDCPAALVIVTGCYAQLNAGDLAALDGGGRLFVVPGGFKAALLELPRCLGESFAAGQPLTGKPAAELLARWAGAFPEGRPFAFNPGRRVFHARPSLKVQDGCDYRCAYCRVSLARGGSVSLAAGEALSRLRALEAGGAGEAVLTGVNIALYRDGGMGLGALLLFLLENTRRISLRLSSLEPGPGLSPEFFRALRDPRIRPHFHISLQSGSAPVLERMGRRYGPGDITALLSRLRAEKDDPFLACDVITGFPGEGPADFEATYALCAEAGFAGIHAFPYSRRPGTAAYSLRPPVAESVAVSRADRLRGLARQGRAAYAARWLGRVVEAIPEGGAGRAPEGCAAAVTENYLRALVPAGSAPLRCRLLPPPGPQWDALGEPVGGP
jgi:threonylcarbamoyladenosine tRNA methylthiotransferase MtaB